MARRLSGLVAPALAVLLAVVLTGCGNVSSSGAFDHYVALGDSYTAAPGVPVTDPSDPCLRSTGNYPSRLARALGIKDLQDRSCGGAQTTAMTKPQGTGIPPQFDALSKRTDLVTLGIGGNDLSLFANLILGCVDLGSKDPQGSPCTDFAEDAGKNVLEDLTRTIRRNVTGVLGKVKELAPSARVVVVGYPQPFPSSGSCRQLPLATGDYAYAATVVRELNAALRDAADATGATWVDVATASKGHDICSDAPWVNGAVTDPDAAAAYHPFAEEQAAVARMIEKALEK